MKFMFKRTGQLSLFLLLSVSVTSCQVKEDFFATEEYLMGPDGECFRKGPDLASCLAIGNECKPAYYESENETQEPEFMACIANPDYVPPVVPVDPVDPVVEIPPEIDETAESKCANLDDKYRFVKKIVTKKGASYVSKVKVCHMTGNGSSHTIIIACPALHAHINHHDDYIGVCKSEE
jgi:hypothetical protein